MSRVTVDWRSASKENYLNFCKNYSSIKLTFEEWKIIIYTFNENFKEYILESGEKAKLPCGFGDFSINKKKRKKLKSKDGRDFINLPVDWKKTKERGKLTYNFNYHTEGYFFGWHWFKESARFKGVKLWFFKPSRVTSRLLAHYVNADVKYQHIYKQWNN